MKSAPQELLRAYVQEQKFTSTADIMEAMKEMFRDVIQQVMEVELEAELGQMWCWVSPWKAKKISLACGSESTKAANFG